MPYCEIYCLSLWFFLMWSVNTYKGSYVQFIVFMGEHGRVVFWGLIFYFSVLFFKIFY